MEIEQLANLKRTLRILANEWLVQWFQGFKNVQLFARQIVPRRNLIVPHEMSVKIRRERRLLIAVFLIFTLLILLLCVHKEVARNAPALHAGPPAFFYEKSLAKKLFICLG